MMRGAFHIIALVLVTSGCSYRGYWGDPKVYADGTFTELGRDTVRSAFDGAHVPPPGFVAKRLGVYSGFRLLVPAGGGDDPTLSRPDWSKVMGGDYFVENRGKAVPFIVLVSYRIRGGIIERYMFVPGRSRPELVNSIRPF